MKYPHSYLAHEHILLTKLHALLGPVSSESGSFTLSSLGRDSSPEEWELKSATPDSWSLLSASEIFASSPNRQSSALSLSLLVVNILGKYLAFYLLTESL